MSRTRTTSKFLSRKVLMTPLLDITIQFSFLVLAKVIKRPLSLSPSTFMLLSMDSPYITMTILIPLASKRMFIMSMNVTALTITSRL